MKLVRIPTSNIDEVWPLVKKDIADALVFSGNHTDEQFVFDTLKQEKFQLFIVWDKDQKTTLEKYYGVVVTEIVEKKLTKACHIFIMTGRQRQKWTALIKVIEDFAEQNNINLRLLHQERLYPGHARNIGISNASNSLLAFFTAVITLLLSYSAPK